MAPWIVQFFPDHETYLEPFGGAAGVLMQKTRCYAEIYNDLDGNIVNVFRVLQDLDKAKELQRRLLVTPYARAEFELSYQETEDEIEMARRVLVRAAMGFGSAGAVKNTTGFRCDMRRSYGTASHVWAEYPAAIASFCERLRGVLIENRPAIECLNRFDSPTTLHYIDPPYLPETRVWRSHGYYRFEMDEAQHEELLKRVLDLTGFVVVSGYESNLYNDLLCGWTVHRTRARMSAGRGTGIRTECVWLNPKCAERQGQHSMFGGAG